MTMNMKRSFPFVLMFLILAGTKYFVTPKSRELSVEVDHAVSGAVEVVKEVPKVLAEKSVYYSDELDLSLEYDSVKYEVKEINGGISVVEKKKVAQAGMQGPATVAYSTLTLQRDIKIAQSLFETANTSYELLINSDPSTPVSEIISYKNENVEGFMYIEGESDQSVFNIFIPAPYESSDYLRATYYVPSEGQLSTAIKEDFEGIIQSMYTEKEPEM